MTKKFIKFEGEKLEILECQVGFLSYINPYEKGKTLQMLLDWSVEELEELREVVPAERPPTECTDQYISFLEHNFRALINHTEEIASRLPDLIKERWFEDFHSKCESIHWRLEEGRYKGTLRELWEIRRDAHQLRDNLYKFIFEKPVDLTFPFVEDERTMNDLEDARNAFALNHFSTGLFVLGRLVDRLVREVGELRKIRKVYSKNFDKEKPWDNATFYQRTLAIKQVQFKENPIINKEQYHIIQILRDYRNKCAHKEYLNISKEKAFQRSRDAFELIKYLHKLRSKLQETPDENIKPIKSQTIDP